VFGVLAWCCLAEWIKNQHTGGAGCNGWWGAAMTMVMAMAMQASYHDRMGLLAFGIVAQKLMSVVGSRSTCTRAPSHHDLPLVALAGLLMVRRSHSGLRRSPLAPKGSMWH